MVQVLRCVSLQVTGVQTQLREKSERSVSLSEQLCSSQSRLQLLQSQSEEKSRTIGRLTQELETLRHHQVCLCTRCVIS